MAEVRINYFPLDPSARPVFRPLFFLQLCSTERLDLEAEKDCVPETI
jgi:hypothetical protein